MAEFTREAVKAQLKALGIPFKPEEIEEITERLNGYVTHLEELRNLPLEGVYPLDIPPVPEAPDA